MADVFDIDSGSRMDYHRHRNEMDNYNHRGHGRWTPVESNSARKDPRLASRRDNRRNASLERSSVQMYDNLGGSGSPIRQRYSRSPSPRRRGHHRRSSERCSLSPPRRSSDRDGWHSPQPPQMYTQPPLPQQSYQQPPPPSVYQHEQYNTTGYPPSVTSYQQGYGQVYGQPQSSGGFNQYNSPAGYPQQNQGYNSGHQQPGPPGDEYPGAWAPVPTAYHNLAHPPPVARPSPAPISANLADVKKDNLKKEAAIANEMKQQQATLTKQRDEYLRKASVLRRELDKLRLQKHELLSVKSPPRDSQQILRANAKLQLEIQNKLKSINNVLDMLSGIIGEGLKGKDEEINASSNSPNRAHKQDHLNRSESVEEEELQKRTAERSDIDMPSFNYIHYDPELHWCRVCDVFPRSAKDFLNHLHCGEHRQVTQEHQLVDTPWHKLPTDEELPSFKGAPVKRVPIKGLQFFISATAWYCKLCDTWIGDLHCASLHLKSKNHSHNYSNFVEQNPHWEINWIKDREKAFERCGKLKLQSDEEGVPPAPEPPLINDKMKRKKRKDKHDSSFLDSSKEKKRKKKSKKRKKMESSGSSSSSSSSDSSSEEDSDRSKSIRVAMRNKMRLQAQMILKEEMEGKLEALGRLVEEDRKRQTEIEERQTESNIEDNIINQWMTVNNNTNSDKHILDGLKGRLKQRQEADKEKAEQAAAEQRKREREREERELKEMREREQRDMEAKMREEQEKEEHDREERERIKERERVRRRHHSNSNSPERFGVRGRSRSVDRRGGRSHGRGRSQERQYRRNDKRPEKHSIEIDKYRPKRTNFDEERSAYESHFEKQAAESAKSSKEKKTTTSTTSRKLPFIGRMPLFKKKGDGEEKEIKKEDYDIRQSKFEAVSSARAFIPAPGVVHITKLATPPDPLHMIRINAENPPPPPQIIPEPPQISDLEAMAPPPPIITPTADDMSQMEGHDMDLDDVQAPPLPPGVPVAEAKPLAKPAGNHLPRDFQDALNIIFPGEQRPDQMALSQDQNLMMQYQYGMGYGMMYPGMQMYDYSIAQDTATSAEECGNVPQDRPAEAEPPPPASNDDDLAMLGIDAADMAAQCF